MSVRKLLRPCTIGLLPSITASVLVRWHSQHVTKQYYVRYIPCNTEDARACMLRVKHAGKVSFVIRCTINMYAYVNNIHTNICTSHKIIHTRPPGLRDMCNAHTVPFL